MERRVLRGSTATLVGYPRLRPGALVQGGASTTPSALVRTPASPDGESSTNGCAREETTASTTEETDAGERELAVDIDDGDFIAGRRYLIFLNGEVGDGDSVVVEARATTSSSPLRLQEPLPCAVPAGALLVGFAVTRQLTADETAVAGEASVEWTATIDGEEQSWSDLFHIVRRLPKATLTASRLLMHEPSVRGLQQPSDPTFETLIAGGWERLQTILENNGAFVDEVASDESLEQLHACACYLLAIETDPRFAGEFVERQQARFRGLETSTFNRVSYDEQRQDAPVYPRDPTKREDRKKGIRLTR